jgi:hypothetical protein
LGGYGWLPVGHWQLGNKPRNKLLNTPDGLNRCLEFSTTSQQLWSFGFLTFHLKDKSQVMYRTKKNEECRTTRTEKSIQSEAELTPIYCMWVQLLNHYQKDLADINFQVIDHHQNKL